MGSRNPEDEGEGPFYNNPIVGHLVKTFEPWPLPEGDCGTRVAKAACAGLGLGVFYNMVAVPWMPDPVDHLPKKTTVVRDNWKHFRSGFARPMAACSVALMAFSGVECLFETLRDPEGKSRHWNAAAGGFASGVVIGALTRRVDTSLVLGGVMAGIMGSLSFSGLHYVNDPHQMAMKVGGKWPRQYKESKELAALKEKYPEFADL